MQLRVAGGRAQEAACRRDPAQHLLQRVPHGAKDRPRRRGAGPGNSASVATTPPSMARVVSLPAAIIVWVNIMTFASLSLSLSSSASSSTEMRSSPGSRRFRSNCSSRYSFMPLKLATAIASSSGSSSVVPTRSSSSLQKRMSSARSCGRPSMSHAVRIGSFAATSSTKSRRLAGFDAVDELVADPFDVLLELGHRPGREGRRGDLAQLGVARRIGQPDLLTGVAEQLAGRAHALVGVVQEQAVRRRERLGVGHHAAHVGVRRQRPGSRGVRTRRPAPRAAAGRTQGTGRRGRSSDRRVGPAWTGRRARSWLWRDRTRCVGRTEVG